MAFFFFSTENGTEEKKNGVRERVRVRERERDDDDDEK